MGMTAREVGLNADLLDGLHARAFALLDGANTFTGPLVVGTVTSAPTTGAIIAVETGLHIGAGYTAPPTGGMRTEGQLIVEAGGLSVLAGTTAVQALTATQVTTADLIGPSNDNLRLKGTAVGGALQFFLNGVLELQLSPGGAANFQGNAVSMGALTASGQIKNNTTSATLLGHDTPATGNPRLDVVGITSTAAPHFVGAERTSDAVEKSFNFGVRHFTNIEEPMVILSGHVESGLARVRFGAVGQTSQAASSMNVPTIYEWYTAANPTTLIGTLAADLTGVGPDALFGLRGAMAMFVKAADPATVANAAHIYTKDVASSAEVFVQNEGGVATQISSHDPETGQFYHFSIRKGRATRIWLERFIERVVKELDLEDGGYIERFSVAEAA